MSHIAEWKTRVHLFEEERTTKVRVELDTGTTRMTGHGTAHCHPVDENVPEIGDELAAARAFEDLAVQLKRVAFSDMDGPGAGHRSGPDAPATGWLDMAGS